MKKMNEENSNDSLEKQITSMLNNVIGDEEEDEIYEKLSFSDELEKENIYQIQKQDYTDFNNIRNSKTFHNAMINDNDNLFKIQKKDYSIRNSKTYHYNNNLNINNNQNNIINRLNKKNQTVNLNINDIPLIPNNLMINNNENSNYKRHNFQTQIVNNPSYMNNIINYYNNNYININTNSNSGLMENYINYNRDIERKKTYDIKKNSLEKNKIKENKFGSALVPNTINLKLEMLIYEMKKLLLKYEKIDYYIFSKLQGNIISIIKTHKGSRIFQNYLKNTQCEILHQILLEILPQLSELLINPYANYFCKKFFTFLNQKDRIEFLTNIKSSLYSLCTNNIGTYPIQGIIEYLGSKAEKNIIINEIKFKIKELCIDPYGAHVIEKILSCFEEENIVLIYKYISDNFLLLAYDSNGICIIKKIVSFIHKKKLHENIKSTVKEHSMEIIKHTYGNFIIQSIIENWDSNEVKEIMNLYINNLIDLSLEKFASNVIERFIEKDNEVLLKFINDLVISKRSLEVMKDNYGNFVIQKALKLAFGPSKNILVIELYNNVDKLNNKKLILKWKSLIVPYITQVDKFQSNNINFG